MKVKRKQRIRGKSISLFFVLMALPFCMGGCPEFRNESVNAFETASRGIIDAAVDLFFDQFRTDNAV